MSITRPFAYNTGSTINGTTQVGSLAIGVTSQDYSSNPGGVPWWMGGDEELGYIIAHPVSGNTQPTPIPGTFASFGLNRTTDFLDSTFIVLAEYVSKKYSTPQSFSSATQASIWLTSNGFWNSYVLPLLYLDSGNPSSYSGSGSVWYDLSGNNNDATLINTPTYSATYSGILQFDSATFETANTPDLGNLSAWTVEAWVRFTSVPISSNPNATSIVTNQYTGGTRLNFSIGTNNAPSNYNVCVGFFDGAWHNTAGFAPQANVWYQLVGTYDGTTLRQYINGSASGGTLNYTGTPQSGGQTRLMRRWDATLTPTDYCDGDLAIVEIYNKALTSSQISAHWNSTKSRFGY